MSGKKFTGPQDVMIGVVQNPDLKKFQGKRLAEVAKALNEDPKDALFDILIQDKAFTECAVFGMSEPDVALALQQPWVSIDNDSSRHVARRPAWRGASAPAEPTAPFRASCASM